MYIKNIKIRNFRNIEKLDISLDKNVNIFIGKNAQGKTSILESIYVLALSKPSRNIDDFSLVKNGYDFTRVIGDIRVNRTNKKLDFLINKGVKTLKINNNDIKKVSDYISNLNIIMFSPDDLDVIKKSPIVRRNLINTTLCQLFPNYLRVLNEYNKLLKIRNEYLKNNCEKIDRTYLDIITDNLVDRALVVMSYREKFITFVNSSIDGIYEKIMKQKGLNVRYIKSIDSNDKEYIKKLYKDNFYNEVNKKMTLFGPHRDDIDFYIDDMNIKLYGSQGQQRVSILAFKLSLITIFKESTGNYPVVLLDDIFSELDLEKRKNLLKFIKSNIQFIITTTDLNNIGKKLIEKAKIFEIIDGKVKEGKKHGKE